MTHSKSIAFFDQQYRHQLKEAPVTLNPFEQLAIPHLRGDVLDFGCGLGNLAFAAADIGCQVTALDASPAAIEHIRHRAAATGAMVSASVADLRDYSISADYDCIVCIGLLMFFDCPTAFKVLSRLQSHVRPGGIAVINVLVEGTTYIDMFEPAGHCLFAPSEMLDRFKGWRIEHSDFVILKHPKPRSSGFQRSLRANLTIACRQSMKGWLQQRCLWLTGTLAAIPIGLRGHRLRSGSSVMSR